VQADGGPARSGTAAPTATLPHRRAGEEITRIRRLITRIKNDLADLAGDQRAAVDRRFLYQHRDLLGKIQALDAAPPAPGDPAGSAATRALP
jgi:hypothetical protein